MVDVKSWAVGAVLLSAAVGARCTNHRQPAAGAGREARARRRGAGPRALAGDAQLAARRPGRHADGLGTRQLRPRCARRPPLRQRLARLPLYRRRRPHVGVRRRRRGVPVRVVRAARKRLHRLRLPPGVRAQRLWYSVHLERADGNPATPDFIPPGYGAERRDVSQRHHGVESQRSRARARSRARGASCCASRTSCSSRAIRWAHVEFNPTARPGSPDYGLLYTSGSDLGFSNGGGPNANNPSATQRLDSVITAILRIDPRSPRETQRRERASATTRFRPTTSSRPTATRRRSARSMPTVSATRIGCRGT